MSSLGQFETPDYPRPACELESHVFRQHVAHGVIELLPGIAATAPINTCENCRPRAAAICATSRVGPRRSNRPRSEACSEVGTASGATEAPMTPCRSSGSSLADSAVEPTRSRSITVSWRRSAVSCRLGSVAVPGPGMAAATSASSPIARSIAAIAEHHAEAFLVLACQVSQHNEINAVLGKAPRS